jgi:hypothetical protein
VAREVSREQLPVNVAVDISSHMAGHLSKLCKVLRRLFKLSRKVDTLE